MSNPKANDENDDLKNGKASANPKDGAAPVPIVDGKRVPQPRVLTVKEILEASAERAFGHAFVRRCTTGVHELDQATGGLRPGHVWVFGAETSWGKSSFLVMLADENMRRGKRVLIVSSEDDPSIYGDRLMVRRAKVAAKDYRDGKLNEVAITSVRRVLERALPEPVYLDGRGKSAEWVAAETKLAIARHNIDLVAFDYLQEFRSGRRHQDRRNEVAEVAATLREAIKSANRTGIIFSQITVQEGKKHPDKHSIRESRDVSNAAEAVLLGFTPKEIVKRANGTEIPADTKCVLVDKAKDGIRTTVPLQWEAWMAAFKGQPDPDERFEEEGGS